MLAPQSFTAWLRDSVSKYLRPIWLEVKSVRDALANVQPHLADANFTAWGPSGGGAASHSSTGGAWTVPATMAGTAMTDTASGRVRKVQGMTAATIGALAALASPAAYSRNTGFRVVGYFCPFMSGSVASRRFFAGMSAANPTNAALTAFAGVGVHADVNETTLRIRGNDGVAVDLGVNFPANSANVWLRLELSCEAGGSDIAWRVTNMLMAGDAASVSGTFTGAQVPAVNVFMAARQIVITNAAAGQGTGLGRWYVGAPM